METLVDGIAEDAYEKACEVVTDTVRQEMQKEEKYFFGKSGLIFGAVML